MPATTTSVLPPTRDAAEVLRRLLTLLNSLKTPEDLKSPQIITQFSGVQMSESDMNSPWKTSYGDFQALNEIWVYGYTWQLNDATGLPDLGFSFDKTEEYLHKHPSLTRICQLDLDQFHVLLLNMGYRHYGNSRQESPIRQYQRGRVVMEVAYVGESEERVTHDCIKRISIGFLDRDIDFGVLP